MMLVVFDTNESIMKQLQYETVKHHKLNLTNCIRHKGWKNKNI